VDRLFPRTTPEITMANAFSSFYAPNQTARKPGWQPNRITMAQDEFETANPGLREFLAGAASWSGFAASLLSSLDGYGFLTERQIAAAIKMRATSEAGAAGKKPGRVVELAPIREMFERAVANGYKRPTYRAAGLVLNRAPDTGKNPGALYVKNKAGEYLGKIVGATYSGKPAPGLDEIAADPKGAAVKYGMESGTCSCCGRELSDPVSISNGIGPVCASRFGF
jgi:hypothetical protein